MAQAHPGASARSDEQLAEERAMAEVTDVLLNLEHTLSRAKKARKRLASGVEGHNARLALDDAVKSLEVARKRLQQDAYFAGDDLRLI